jgi:DNA topoisomerase-3
MGKTILQRQIPPEQVVKLLTTGKTDLLPRFISKKGKPFSAFLKLNGAKVGFEFEERKPKAKKVGATSRAASKSPAKTVRPAAA